MVDRIEIQQLQDEFESIVQPRKTQEQTQGSVESRKAAHNKSSESRHEKKEPDALIIEEEDKNESRSVNENDLTQEPEKTVTEEPEEHQPSIINGI